MKNIITILFTIMTAISVSSYGQTSKIDSLKKAISVHKNDTNKISALIDLGDCYQNPDSAIYFYHQAADLANSLKAKELESKGYTYIAYTSFMTGKTDQAHEYYQKALSIQEEMGNKEGIAKHKGYLGSVYSQLSKFTDALEYYQAAYKLFEELKDNQGMADNLGNIGRVYGALNNYDKALEYYQRSLKIYEEDENDEGIKKCFGNIGLIYSNQEDYEKALEYMKKALKLAEASGEKLEIAIEIGNIGSVYVSIGDYTQALENYQKAYETFEEIGEPYGMAISHEGIGNAYYYLEDYSNALSNYSAALQIHEEIGNTNGVALAYANIALVHNKLENHQKAIGFAEKALKLAKETGSLLWQRDSYQHLSDGYKGLKDYKKALEYKDMYIEFNDSIYNADKLQAIEDMRTRYETEKKEQKILLQESELVISKEQTAKEKAEKETQQAQRNMFIVGFALMIILAVYVFYSYRQKKKANIILADQKKQIEEKNHEIMDSISYAKRIQEAILPPNRLVKEWLMDSFILYKPKDIVAGDFYWMENIDGLVIFAAADCTGHGVPGAMVSVVCHNAMNRAVREFKLTKPSDILGKTRELVIETFEKSDNEVKDGMDIALCAYDPENKKISYSGANNSLYYISEEKLIEVKADKQPIGKHIELKPFTNHDLELKSGDTLYIFSDGFADQFGGEKGKKFKYKPFRELLLTIHQKDMEEQKQILNTVFEEWRGNIEQIDDVVVMGVRV